MKEFLQLMRRFVSPYKKYIGWAILLNILSAVFNVFSFTLLIPILDILFKGSDITYSINGKQIVLSKSRSNASSNVDKRLLTGTVIDSKGEAVIGANVIVKGDRYRRKFFHRSPRQRSSVGVLYWVSTAGGELWHEKKCDCGFTGK